MILFENWVSLIKCAGVKIKFVGWMIGRLKKNNK